jgi:manganese-dependent ADP-ribose/CDP-alcohol diphosphatase
MSVMKFGIIADIQYVDADDATDFTGKQKRSYRNSLEVVRKAVKKWSNGEGVEFIAQLGDLIDGKAKTNGTEAAACDKVLEELNKCKSKFLINIIGNHDLYNFKRDQLEFLLKTKIDGTTWYSFKPSAASPLRIVVLDSYDVSTIEGTTAENTKAATNFLTKHNHNDISTFGVDWSEGLVGTERRFVPYGGMISSLQLSWVKQTLTAAASAGEAAVILLHTPLCPGACNPLCLLWNYQDVLDIITESGSVIAVFAGHDHDGGYQLLDGVHHFTLPSPLLCLGEELAFATVELFQDRLVVNLEGNRLPQVVDIPFTA